MLFIVIEKIKPENLEAVRTRFREKGRMLPDGVEYRSSWLTLDGKVCYQLMDSPSKVPLNQWICRWKDIVDFEVHEVLTSEDFWERHGASSGKTL
jgi:hypothetical protein